MCETMYSSKLVALKDGHSDPKKIRKQRPMSEFTG